MKSIVFLAMSAAFCAYPAPMLLDTNLIVNPGAEAGPGSPTGDDIVAAPGWTSSGSFTVAQLGAIDAPVPPNAFFGTNFFSGGPGSAISTGTQTIDVSSLASSIDSGIIRFILSGYFGGYLTQPDNAVLKATFVNATGGNISTSTVGGITAAQRNQQTVLLYDGGAGVIPVGTRSVLITLQMNRLQYSYNDGYADNLSFIATTVPEPGTWAMLALGIGLLAVRKPLVRLRRHDANR
jgi:hypothetical protein